MAATKGAPLTPSAALFKALADDTRLTLLRLLAHTDLTVAELQPAVGLPQNLVSYHLRLLREAGLLRAHRSSHDGRDVYYGLDPAGAGLLRVAMAEVLGEGANAATLPQRAATSVLFLCTHNSARSQLAEALLRRAGGDDLTVASAGTEPGTLHPETARLLAGWGIDPGSHHSKGLNTLAGQRFDWVITVCDRAREQCPADFAAPHRLHWSLPDPAAQPAAEQPTAFSRTATDLQARIARLLPLLQATAA